MNNRCLTPREVAELLGVSAACLKRWRSEGRGPRFIRLSMTLVRYREADVEEWIAQKESPPNPFARRRKA